MHVTSAPQQPTSSWGNRQPLVGHSCTPTPPQAPWAPRVPSTAHLPSALRPPSVARAPSAAHAPSGPLVPVTSIATGDLRESSTVTKGMTVMSPLNAGERGTVTSRHVTSRRSLALFHRCVRRRRHGLSTHLDLQPLWGLHGTCTSPLHGCLALQVLSPPTREI
jgi:hypothetical protein